MKSQRPPRARQLTALENRLALLVVAAGAPAVGALCWLLWSQALLPLHPTILLSVLIILLWLGSAWYLRQRLANQWRMLSNLVEAVRLGDFSLRGRVQGDAGGYGELVQEINSLAQRLREQRLRTEETQRLLDKVIRDIDVAIFAFDPQQRLTLANPAACQLLGADWPQLQQQPASELGLLTLLTEEGQRVLDHDFAGATGIWRVQAENFMEQGRSQQLLFVTDLKRVLRAEELNAWKRLIRVLSHEVNNSLAPIASVSASLQSMMAADSTAQSAPTERDFDALRVDLQDGLQVIHQRAQSLTEFIRRYADLARLPPPNKRPISIHDLLARLPALLPDLPLQMHLPAAPVSLFADPVQLEQLLINLLKNAREAMAASPATIEIVGEIERQQLRLQIRDHGPGIGNSANLFVPFYSTKAGGSGIGLVLCRQIAEAHDGTLQLRNRTDGPGCIAEVRLPLALS